MSVDEIPSEKTRSSTHEATLVGYDEYIDAQIRHTRRMVKVVDLATALAVLATGALAYLLVAAVAENWLVPGGFGTLERSLILGVLILVEGQYAYRRVWPLLVHSINPVFAAQTIEQSSPSLKNSLMNLLLFRQRREQITEAVYDTLEEQAAHGLSRVPVDSAVDRTQLIRFGYVLVAIVTLCALYKMLSPKDPLVAVQRVLMPWADIVPASRVSITDVKPGTTTLARGEMLTVSADVLGVGENDPVVVRYTTADGQAVEKAVTMKASESGLRFTAQLPAPAEPGRPTGVSQNLRYRIEAGDARSHVYSVTVVAAPTITVERVDYEYPAYTGFANRSVDGLGDIRGIEGTRVTIHARANSPIKEAAIDFEADGRRDIRMTVDGSEAQASYVLALRDDHQTPKYKSYAVRYTGTDDRANRDPVKYPIDVLPDYTPEAAILAPAEKTLDVRLDETVPISVEARDPDFALSEVRLKGDVGGRAVLDEPLLSKQYPGRFTGRLQFRPDEHGLKAGDVMRYWVVAHDNRKPQANETASEPQTLRIGSPAANQRPPDRLAQREERPRQPGDRQQQQQSEGGQGNKQQPQQPGDGGQALGGGEQGNGQQSGGKSGEPQAGQQAADKSQRDQSSGDQSQKNQSKDNSASDKDKQQGSGESQQQKQQNQAQGKDSQQQQQPGGSESGGRQDKSQKQPGQSSAGGESGKKNSQSGQSGATQSDGGKQAGSKDQQQHDGADGKPGAPQDQKDSQGGSGGKGGHEKIKPNDSPSQVSPEGDNDGEAFDRIQKFLQQQGELRDPNGNQKKPQDSQQSTGENQGGKQGQDANDKSASGKQSQTDGKQGEQKPPADAQKSTGDDGKNPSTDRTGQNSPDKNGSKSDQQRKNDQQGKDDQRGKDTAKEAQGDKQSGKDGGGVKNDGSQNNVPGGENDAKDQSPGKQGEAKSPDGQAAQSTGENGGGQPSQKDQTSPDSGQPLKSADKWQQSPSKTDDKKPGGGQEPPSGGQSKRKSDSQGDQGGDKAGGGTQGGGQQSPHEGTGSSGQNQSADEGTSESTEHGKGDNSPSAGKDSQAKGRTGQSGSTQPGSGSSQRDGQGNEPGGKSSDANQPSGDNAGDKNSSANKDSSSIKPSSSENANQTADGKSSDGKQQGEQAGKGDSSSGEKKSDKNNPDQQSNGQPGDKTANKSNKDGGQSQPGAKQLPGSQSGESGGNTGQSSNNGTPGLPQGAGGPNKTDATAPEADAANLEYARKQTDLVLETLAEQMKHKKVDKRLLDELGWSEQDLQKFIARWQQLKETAQGDTPAADAAQKELDDALRSLGLRSGPMQQGKVTEDKVRDLHEGYHGPVPLEYQERLRAYNQGVSRARQDGE
jgi:hypothetical protein